MERFCDKCGTLVTGDGSFCPNCGAKLNSVVNLSKPDISSNSVQQPYSDPIPTRSSNQTSQNGYSNYSPAYGTPAFSQNNAIAAHTEASMTVGQWVGTILLGSCLGIISIVLLFFWGFSEGTPPEKKNFARAYLIVTAILIGVSIFITIGMVVCVGGLSGILDGYYY